MRSLAVIFVSLLSASSVFSQTAPPATITSDAQAVSLAQQSVAALTGGSAISDVTLNANVTSTNGSDYETGTGALSAKGTSESRIDLNLSGGSLSEVRNAASGVPAGAWQRNGGSATPYAQHNCFTDASWFFPALSSLTQTANSSYIFKYVDQETHNGVSVQHIQVFQPGSNDGGMLQRLTKLDFYLNSSSDLPVAVVFNSHTDNNMNVDLPTEIRFATYQSVSGALVPFHFQKLVNGSLSLDVTITSAILNSGVSDSIFTMQ